jgi:transposase
MTVYIGIDWSEQKHDVMMMNEKGGKVAYLKIEHTLGGFARLDAQLKSLGVTVETCMVGIETSHNQLFDYLLEHQYRVYVLPPSQVHSNQGRGRQSGAKDDVSDAWLIAEILRTDHARLHAWQPDQLLTRQLKARVHWWIKLNQTVVRQRNHLRSVLQRYYPAALAVFSSGVNSAITAAFVVAYPTPHLARGLSQADFAAFTRQHHYPQPQQVAQCYQRLQADFPATAPELSQIYQTEAVQAATLLLNTQRVCAQVAAEVHQLYSQHPKHDAIASLPGVGDLIGAGLLAYLGDDLARFPHPSLVQAIAGTAPITIASGHHRSVRFRQACDHILRFICQEWALQLVHNARSPIALAYFQRIRPHSHSDQHAYRCVANRWLAVAWKVWYTGESYDPARHLQQRVRREQPR